jgi:hypothetical protein
VERVWPARLEGWRRGFNQARDNRASEKSFALADGTVPDWILGLGIEPDPGAAFAPNGGLIELTAAELDRLDVRELRYDRVELTGAVVTGAGAPGFDRIFGYRPKPAQRAAEAPPGAVVLSSYVAAVEAAFAALGDGELAEYRRTTLPCAAEVVTGHLVRDAIPEGNPRAW